jgi:hypothetical protein
MGRAKGVSALLSMRKCKTRLAALWFAAGGALFLILVLQTVFGKYGDQATEVWGWFLPSLLPTLSLVLGVLVMDAQGKAIAGRETNRFLFNLTFALSATYLLLLSLTIFIQPFVSVEPFGLMKQSRLWLGPFQGLVSGSLGAFFVRRQRDANP